MGALAVIFTMFMSIAVPIGVIIAIVLFIKVPKPPVGLSRQEISYWYAGGWKEAYKTKDEIAAENTKRSRKTMKAMAIICFVCSLFCLLLFLGGIIGDDQKAMAAGLASGLFLLVFWKMFATLSKNEKGAPYIYLYGKRIKTPMFVLLCIVIAYAIVFALMGLFGVIA